MEERLYSITGAVEPVPVEVEKTNSLWKPSVITLHVVLQFIRPPRVSFEVSSSTVKVPVTRASGICIG